MLFWFITLPLSSSLIIFYIEAFLYLGQFVRLSVGDSSYNYSCKNMILFQNYKKYFINISYDKKLIKQQQVTWQKIENFTYSKEEIFNSQHVTYNWWKCGIIIPALGNFLSCAYNIVTSTFLFIQLDVQLIIPMGERWR